MKKMLTFFAVIGAIYGILFLTVKQWETLLSFPGVFINTLEFSSKIDVDVQNIDGFVDIFTDIDGKKIHGVWLDNGFEETVYYFHGSGGDVRFFYDEIQKISDLGYNVLAFEYPGYGKSEGFPYEENIYAAARKLYEEVSEKFDITAETTLVWGYSVGTGIALEFARSDDFMGALLFAPYTSRIESTQDEFFLPWQKYFGRKDSLLAKKYIGELDISVIIVHGEKDTILSYEKGKELSNYGKGENVTFIGLPEGNHYNLLELVEDNAAFRDSLKNIDTK